MGNGDSVVTDYADMRMTTRAPTVNFDGLSLTLKRNDQS